MSQFKVGMGDRRRRSLAKATRQVLGVGMIAMLAATQPLLANPLIDGDGDGVDDSADECLYTTPGAEVDVRGCSAANDGDADGIFDDADACPYTPEGAKVDSAGCAVDSDGDGVADGLDRCGATLPGITVDATGCMSTQAAGAASPAQPAKPEIPAPTATPTEKHVTPPVPATSAPTVRSAPSAELAAAAPALLEIRFTAGGAGVGETGQRAIRDALPRLREALAPDKRGVLVVEGYADGASDGATPDTFARARANKLRRLLEAEGIDGRRLRTFGHRAAVSADGKPDPARRRAQVIYEVE